MRANERAAVFTVKQAENIYASVAIDGYCARKNAERMFVRKKRTLYKVNLGGNAVFCLSSRSVKFLSRFGLLFYVVRYKPYLFPPDYIHNSRNGIETPIHDLQRKSIH